MSGDCSKEITFDEGVALHFTSFSKKLKRLILKCTLPHWNSNTGILMNATKKDIIRRNRKRKNLAPNMNDPFVKYNDIIYLKGSLETWAF